MVDRASECLLGTPTFDAKWEYLAALRLLELVSSSTQNHATGDQYRINEIECQLSAGPEQRGRGTVF